MPDFDALNRVRLQTLDEMGRMVRQEGDLWNRFLNGENTQELFEAIEQHKRQFRLVYGRHEAARQAMYDAGFIKPL